MLRRHLLQALGLAGWSGAADALTQPTGMVFPRDFGAHPDTQIEWWYVTGWANSHGTQAALGFQVTFFRSRVPAAQALRSKLAARQLLFAHAAVTDVQGRTLWHDQRLARWSGNPPGQNPLDLASASEKDTAIVLKDWSLVRRGSALRALVQAADFSMDLQFEPTQDVLLQGHQGLSHKSPDPTHTSYYYSQPQLRATGRIQLRQKSFALESGSTAWLDHEWSQRLMDPRAVGWDWVGMNLSDGCALTAFQLRTAEGRALWCGGSWRCGGTQRNFASTDIAFTPQRYWASPSSQARYPVQWLLVTPNGHYTVHALVDAQELDSRQSTGAVYWEGLSELRDAAGQPVGRGYLEMTGYASPLQL